MRPNVDIPWEIHGRIKEHAEQTGQSLEESYVDLLRAGIRSVGDRTGRFDIKDKPNVRFIPINEQLGVSGVNLFSSFGPGYYENQPVAIRAQEMGINLKEAEGILTSLNSKFVLDGSYSIHHKNAGWFGEGGVDSFVYWLRNLTELYDEAPEGYQVDTHRVASAAFISDTHFPARHILIYASPQRASSEDGSDRTLEKFGIEFYLDGFPIEGGRITEFAMDVGLSLGHAIPWDVDNELIIDLLQEEIGGEEGPDIVETIYRETDPDVVEGVVCENPFFEGENQIQDLIDNHRIKRALTNTEYLYAPLKHTVERDRNYDLYITSFSATDFYEITHSPASPININFEVNW